MIALQQATDTTGSLLPIVLIGAFFLFIMFRQRQRQKQRQQTLDSFQVGDRVRTIGGLIGTIVELDDHETVIEVEGMTRLRLLRRALQEPHS
ncbi:MAG: preprotein translocase subunit YajC [Acidimicrobiia bacterium]|nr:preprotein translocase subunit YajC [Acidimicrobiia bacterium]